MENVSEDRVFSIAQVVDLQFLLRRLGFYDQMINWTILRHIFLIFYVTSIYIL